MSSDKTELFAVAIGAFLDIICETFNSQGIPALIDINGQHFAGITEYPKMTHGDIEDADITKVASFIKDMTGIGVLVPDDGLEDYIRQVGTANSSVLSELNAQLPVLSWPRKIKSANTVIAILVS